MAPNNCPLAATIAPGEGKSEKAFPRRPAFTAALSKPSRSGSIARSAHGNATACARGADRFRRLLDQEVFLLELGPLHLLAHPDRGCPSPGPGEFRVLLAPVFRRNLAAFRLAKMSVADLAAPTSASGTPSLSSCFCRVSLCSPSLASIFERRSSRLSTSIPEMFIFAAIMTSWKRWNFGCDVSAKKRQARTGGKAMECLSPEHDSDQRYVMNRLPL